MKALSDVDNELLLQIAQHVQTGKANAATDIPAGTKGAAGVAELARQALDRGIAAQTVLERGLLAGMQVVGQRFAANDVFIPEVLIAARAMKTGIEVLRPCFAEQDIPARGTFVVGTVQGDLHDIGKNLLGMVLEGAGWRVVDLGVDCNADRFVTALEAHPGCVVGLSALLTNTMMTMPDIIAELRRRRQDAVILVGGAPVTREFAERIGASGYAADPPAAITLLDRLAPRDGL